MHPGVRSLNNSFTWLEVVPIWNSYRVKEKHHLQAKCHYLKNWSANIFTCIYMWINWNDTVKENRCCNTAALKCFCIIMGMRSLLHSYHMGSSRSVPCPYAWQLHTTADRRVGNVTQPHLCTRGHCKISGVHIVVKGDISQTYR